VGFAGMGAGWTLCTCAIPMCHPRHNMQALIGLFGGPSTIFCHLLPLGKKKWRPAKGHHLGMTQLGNTMMMQSQVCSGTSAGLRLSYPCNIIPLLMSLWVLCTLTHTLSPFPLHSLQVVPLPLPLSMPLLPPLSPLTLATCCTVCLFFLLYVSHVPVLVWSPSFLC